MRVDLELVGEYRFPAYAASLLYVVTDSGAVQLDQFDSSQQQFSLDILAGGDMRLVWGNPHGPSLAWWRCADESSLQWDGRVKVGGFIERLHAGETGGLEYVIAEVVGGPFYTDHVGLPSMNDIRGGVFARPADTEPLAKDQAYPFIMLAESNLAALAQDAFISGLAVDAYGTLASDANSWQAVVGLPLLLDTLTLLAP